MSATFGKANNTVLLIGSGGRENAIAWKLAQSNRVEKLFVLPGSHHISKVPKVELVTNVNVTDRESVVDFCKKTNVDLVFVGPEDPLADGIADVLNAANIKCFGPSKSGARIESDKAWSKEFMIQNKIPTARFQSHDNALEAKTYILK